MEWDPLPFTRQPGMLYVSPLESPLPDNTVRDGRFAVSWPLAWLQVGGTDPGTCLAVSVLNDHRWTFGGLAGVQLGGLLGSLLRPAFMLGWESEDAKDRLVAHHAVVQHDGVCRPEWVAGRPPFTWYAARTAEEHRAEAQGRPVSR